MIEDSLSQTDSENPYAAPVPQSESLLASIELAEEPSTVDDPPACWYCGVGEAIAWFGGTLGVHLAGGIAVLIAAVVVVAISTGKVPKNVEEPQMMFAVTAGEMLIFVLACMLAISIRYWGRTFRELNFSVPDYRHVLIVVLATLPLSFLVSAWSVPVQLLWTKIVESVPVLSILDQMNGMEVIRDMSRNTSLLMLILVIAVLPAIGEELVFRGAVGRALIANLGLWWGVCLTSFLFGCIHIHPVHAIAVIPLGFAIHLIYLWGRSFWLPMLLHFLNNTFAAISTKTSAVDPLSSATSVTAWEAAEILLGAVAVVAFAIAFWQSRVRYIQEDGTECESPRFPVRVATISTVRRHAGPINSACWAIAIASSLFCHLLVAVDLLQPMMKAD